MLHTMYGRRTQKTKQNNKQTKTEPTEKTPPKPNPNHHTTTKPLATGRNTSVCGEVLIKCYGRESAVKVDRCPQMPAAESHWGN